MVQPARLFRFGPFELDVRARQLRKHGVRLRLPDQSFHVLLLLLEQPGEVVLRDEIQRKLWPNTTIVEFKHSIYAAVKRLRTASGDVGEAPRYIETVAKRGYRFLGKRAFEGESAASVISSILERDPTPVTTAPPLERIVCRCLAKDPDQRFQTARDLKATLTWAMEQTSAKPAAHSRDRRWLVAALTVGVALAGIAAWGWLRPRPVQLRTILRWTVPLAAVRETVMV